MFNCTSSRRDELWKNDDLSLLLKFEVNIKLYCAKFAQLSLCDCTNQQSIVGCFLFISQQRLNAILAVGRPPRLSTPISYLVFSISYLLVLSLCVTYFIETGRGAA
jgi:hypothetical protein